MENNSKYLLIDKKVQEYFEQHELSSIFKYLNKFIRDTIDFIDDEMVIVSRTSKYIGSPTSIKINCIGLVSNRNASITIEHSKYVYDDDQAIHHIKKIADTKFVVDDSLKENIITYQLECIDYRFQLVKRSIVIKEDSSTDYTYKKTE